MARKRVHGTSSPTAPRRDHNGFVNRRSTVQSGPPAPDSEKSVFTRVIAERAIAGYRCGLVKAGTAAAAIAFLLRNPSEVSTDDLTAMAADLTAWVRAGDNPGFPLVLAVLSQRGAA